MRTYVLFCFAIFKNAILLFSKKKALPDSSSFEPTIQKGNHV